MDILPTLEEILTSEPLARVIAYLAAILETRAADGDWSALAHSVLASHIEARHRCLNLMVFGYGFPVEQAVRLNRLRRLMEFFNDSLISSLPPIGNVDLYGFDIPLVQHQQKQFRNYPVSEPIDQVRVQSLVSTIDQSLRRDHNHPAANPRLNENIAEAVLALMPPELFDSFGLGTQSSSTGYFACSQRHRNANQRYRSSVGSPIRYSYSTSTPPHRKIATRS